MTSRLNDRRGFTLLELLVVIGIIGLLLALLAPALSGVRRQGRVTRQKNNLRQVGTAWNVYSNSNSNAILPGYIDYEGPNDGAQGMWTATFRFPDGEPIPAALAAPWPWRLWPYLDNATFLLDYTFEDIGRIELLNEPGLQKDLAERPRFGYNAYHIGGWYERQELPEGSVTAMPKFYDSVNQATGNPVNVVTRSLGAMRRPTELVVFSGAATYSDARAYTNLREDAPGSHVVTPPYLGEAHGWRADALSIEILENNTGAPAARITGQIPVLHGDMHTSMQTFGDLDDMRRWIDIADSKAFTHSP